MRIVVPTSSMLVNEHCFNRHRPAGAPISAWKTMPRRALTADTIRQVLVGWLNLVKWLTVDCCAPICVVLEFAVDGRPYVIQARRLDMSEVDFVKRYGPWALVAGGSEGLGVAFAHRLAKLGLNLILVARKPGPLEALAADVRDQSGREVRTLSLDLTASDAVARIVAATAGCDVGLLIYNAGADNSFKPFMERPVADAERMAQLNVIALLRLVRHFADPMVKRGQGGIITMSSMASLGGYPGNLVYAASKAFSNIFTEGLWYELGKHGVHVLGMTIGLARTPAMERLGIKFDGSVPAAEPYDLVDDAIANIDKGPTIYARGLDERAQLLRSLPRAKAVRTLAREPNP